MLCSARWDRWPVGFLRSGRIRLHGRTPNGQGFKAAPLRVWRVVGGHAELDGADLGALAPLPEQTRLGDFWLPQRGLFFAGQARFTHGTGPDVENPSDEARLMTALDRLSALPHKSRHHREETS